MRCIHNQRMRYTHGYYCEDCKTFFGKNTPTYRSTEMLSDIWMVLNNINVDLYREGKEKDEDVTALKERIGINKRHEDYEDIIREAELLMAKYAKDSESASIELRG